MNLIGTYYQWKNWVDWLSTRLDKMLQPQNVHFEKNPKVKKDNNFTFHDYLPQFCSENRNGLSWMVESILKARNVNDAAC